jgi:UDP-glucose 4-epimerase
MNILITGGAGFIASNIADAYLRAGHRVVVVDNLSTGFRGNVPAGAVFCEMDIRDEGIGDVLARHRIDVVNHHAAQIDVRRSVEDPKLDLSINVLGSLNLLQAAANHGLARFIFASTGGAIYGEQEYFPADERHPTAPCSPYGITKLTVEKYLHYFRVERGLTTTVLRYTNVYGPRQSPHGEAGVVAIFCDRMLRGEEPVINGDGLQTRDYVFVADVVRANLLALGMTGSATYNVCTGVESTVVDIFRNLNTGFETPFREVHGPAKPGEQRRSVCTSAAITEALGWRSSVTLADGLRETLDFFRARHNAQ